MKSFALRTVVGSLILISSLAWAVKPDPNKTPGFLCSASDPDFQGYYYSSHVARCKRNVSQGEKDQIAKEYGGIPHADWPKYEFDHLYPLCAGGSDDVRNVWPQPIDEAHLKDAIENKVCLELQAGTTDQAGALKEINDWIAQH